MENENKIDPKRIRSVSQAIDLAFIEMDLDEQRVLKETLTDGITEALFYKIVPRTIDEVMQQVEVSSKFTKKFYRHLKK